MHTIHLACVEARNILNNCNSYLPNNGQLSLGRGHNISLFFLIPTGMMREGVRRAALNLYKIPCSRELCGCSNHYYEIYPLFREERPYTERFCEFFIDCNRRSTFYEGGNSFYTTIDITDIVNSWIDEGREEGELLIKDNCSSHITCYASRDYPVREIHPAISCDFDNYQLKKPLSAERVLVKVAPTLH